MPPYDPFEPGGCGVDVRRSEAYDAARDRTFPVDVWSPATATSSPRPLIVYSHHSGGHRRAATYLCTHLASHGYVVAALDHSEVVDPALTPPAAATPPERLEWARQRWVPARVPDVRFLIDEMVERGDVDAGRIGIVGHSFGGWTALAAPEQDDRIGAVVALAPGGGEPTPPAIIPATLSFEWSRPVPTMYVVAADDAFLPLAGIRQLYERTPGRPQMVVLQRADHLHFVDDVEQAHEHFRVLSSTGPIAEIQARMRPIVELCSGEQAHLLVRGLTVAHLDATLRQRPEATAWLGDDLAATIAARGVEATVVEPAA